MNPKEPNLCEAENVHGSQRRRLASGKDIPVIQKINQDPPDLNIDEAGNSTNVEKLRKSLEELTTKKICPSPEELASE